ncbi:beta-lactamase-like protein [Aspergillus insuetus]
MAIRSRAICGICRSRPTRLLQQHTVTLSKYTLAGRPGVLNSHQPFPPRQLRLHPYMRAMRHHSTASHPNTENLGSPRANSVGGTEPAIHNFFENKTGTWQYMVADPTTSEAAIIDAVLDYDPATREISTASADFLLSFIRRKNYKIAIIMETHAHADHLSAATYLQARLALEQGFRPPISIGARISEVQQLFGERYGIPADKYRDVFDKLFKDDETFTIGNLTATAMHLPGHTPDHMGYKIGDHVFCGDSIFHIDLGTARCDFPGGSAEMLFNSGRRLLDLPDHTKLWFGHDYPSEERKVPVPCMTVSEHKSRNKHLKHGVTMEEFVAVRRARDAKLAAPNLLHPSLQINIRAGRLPQPAVISFPLRVNDMNI